MGALPVTVGEVLKVLQNGRFWQRLSHKGPSNVVRTVGLCVSGGPDSMALASLMNRIQRSSPPKPFNLRAYVVDHKFRKESTTEAHTISSRLLRLGIESEILTFDQSIRLSNAIGPLGLESYARSLRYRLLARACHEAGIDELLTGHHQDDQIETILMRMIRGFNEPQTAFLGMEPVAPLPDTTAQLLWASRSSTVNLGTSDDPEHATIVPMHELGINLRRPLLDFPKARLLETCKVEDIDYVLDATNVDPKLTVRNAIRHLRANYRLPRALSTPSVLSLRRSANENMSITLSQATLFFKMIRVLSFDFRSGIATVHFSEVFLDKVATHMNATRYVLARLLYAVSHIPQAREQKLVDRNLVETLFHKHLSTVGGNPPSSKASRALTIHGVTMERVSLPGSKRLVHPVEPTVWRFSRQNVREHEVCHQQLNFQRSGGNQSAWMLWDNRFWMRITCRDEKNIQHFSVKHMGVLQLATIRARVGHNVVLHDNLQRALGQACPGRKAHNIPVIMWHTDPMALPSLNIRVPPEAAEPAASSRQPLISWQIRYKAIGKEVQDCIDHRYETKSTVDPV